MKENMTLFKLLTFNIPGFLKRQNLCIWFAVFLLLLGPALAYGQKKNFTNYGIEDGLLQSQVTRIMQDNTHQLVIQTFLGTERFDGKTFSALTRDNVVTESSVAVTIDHDGKIWCSNAKGLYYIYAGNTTRFTGGL